MRRTLAEACLSTDPRARPTSAELVARLRTLLGESGALQVRYRRHNNHHQMEFSKCGFSLGMDGTWAQSYFGANRGSALVVHIMFMPSRMARMPPNAV